MKIIEIKCEGRSLLPIEELKDFQGNLKTLSSENYAKLKEEILRHGFSEPVSVWKSDDRYYILNGHQRVKTLSMMRDDGYIIPEVPVNFIKAKDKKEAKELVLALTSQFGEMTDEGLFEFSKEAGIDLEYLESLRFPEIDLEKWDDFDNSAEAKGDPDEVPDVPVEPISKLGDLYELGEHRLLCGDSTLIDAVEKLMNGEKADMVFTDPPYGMSLDTDYTTMKSEKSKSRNSKHYKTVAGDSDDFTPDLINTIFSSFPDSKEVFIWGADYFAELIPNRNEGSMIVWDKTGGNDSLTNIYGSNFELCWSKGRHKRHIMRTTWKGFTGHHKVQDGAEKVHPTQKPIKLIDQFLERWGKETKTVADLFGGSGSTLIACEKTNRKCFMMELDPHYIDVIVSRWCKYTGQTKIKKNGEEIEW